MHSSSAVDVVLAISSNPVIEHCSAIRFGDLNAYKDSHVRPTVVMRTHTHIETMTDYTLSASGLFTYQEYSLDELDCPRGHTAVR
jgi:hypothetical protein